MVAELEALYLNISNSVDQASALFEGYFIDGLFKMEEDFKRLAETFEELGSNVPDVLTEAQIWESYNQVVPRLGNAGLQQTQLNGELKELLLNMRLRYSEEV